MSRFFRKKEVELLAPAGTFNIFQKVINSGADAVYFGGKKLNMRMHKKDHNFTNDEIKEAISVAHALDKKVYITLNNMLNSDELKDAKDFLLFLDKVKPDAVIVQDFSVVKMINELNLNLPIHSSVMMNVHNITFIHRLRELGVNRVVLSREMTLETIKGFSKDTDMEFEYFAHGDMCIAHGAQCLYSGVLFGKSSNRGLCMKPCRWPYAIEHNHISYCQEYPLAVKDMCMYRHIPNLIDANVTSFKIEGRMRDSDYLVALVNQYSNAIDRYINDPTGYYIDEEEFKHIEENKARDLSTAYAFKVPGKSNINIHGQGEPRVFSKATEELEIKADRLKELMALLDNKKKHHKPLLSVKVNNAQSANSAIDSGADCVYLSLESYNPYKPFSKNQMLEVIEYGKSKNCKIYLSLPQMTSDHQIEILEDLMEQNLPLSGIVSSNLGAISAIKKYDTPQIGDFSLNIYNEGAIAFYHQEGLKRVTLSIEAKAQDLKNMLTKTHYPTEIIVQGSPTVMYLDHNLYITKDTFSTSHDCIGKNFNSTLSLIDEKHFKHPVYVDSFNKNHILMNKDLCYLPILSQLASLGVCTIRIEGQHYSPEVLSEVVKLYRKTLDNLKELTHEENMTLIKNIIDITHRKQTLGPLNFD